MGLRKHRAPDPCSQKKCALAYLKANPALLPRKRAERSQPSLHENPTLALKTRRPFPGEATGEARLGFTPE